MKTGATLILTARLPINGEIAKALFAKAKDLFSKPPDIAKPEVLAVKSART
jgi:hypothetical protein